MVTTQLTGLTLANLQNEEKVTIDFNSYKAVIGLEDEETILVSLVNTETQSTVIPKEYKATEKGLSQALKDLQPLSQDNIQKTLSKSHNFHVMYSGGNGSEVDSVGCNSTEQAFAISEHMLYSLKGKHGAVEYVKAIDKEGKLLFDLDEEQENVMEIY